MITKAQGDGAITLIGKEVEEVLIPTPGSMPPSVNKKQRNGMRFGGRPLVDHFKHGRPFNFCCDQSRLAQRLLVAQRTAADAETLPDRVKNTALVLAFPAVREQEPRHTRQAAR